MKWLCSLATTFLFSCQLGYLAKTGYHQVKLMSQRTPIEEILNNPAVPEETKTKLRLAQEASEFSEKELHLSKTDNYSSYVELDRTFPVYAVHAAEKWRLEHHHWYFPIVGNVPYLGFFNEDDAKDEASELAKKNFDVFTRGVSAYSTLGWFSDPIWSSMLRYKEHDLVNTIIHETVHATLYIKSSADFNERMAVFLGNRGAELFYLKKEGPKSKTLALIKKEVEDDKIFSEFIGQEISKLEQWYKDRPENFSDENLRKKRLKEIQDTFRKTVQPRMKAASYSNFTEIELNNARLLLYKTYLQDLSDFEALYGLVNQDFREFLICCEKLKSHPTPEDGLKDLIKDLQTKNRRNCGN